MSVSSIKSIFASLFSSRAEKQKPVRKKSTSSKASESVAVLGSPTEQQQTKTQLPLPELSAQQKELMRASWAKVHEHLDRFGSVALLNHFEHKLDFKKAFLKFKDMPVADLRSSPVVKMHAMAVLHTIEQIVYRLDCPENWTDIVNTLGRRHVNFNAIACLAPDVAAYCWLAMKQMLEQHGFCDPSLDEAWIQVFQWLGAAVELSINEHYKLADQRRLND